MMNRMNDELMNQVNGSVDAWNQAPQSYPGGYSWYQDPQSGEPQYYSGNSWNQAPQGMQYMPADPYQGYQGNQEFSWNQPPYYTPYGNTFNPLPTVNPYS